MQKKSILNVTNGFVERLKQEILCILGLKVNGQYFLLYVGEFQSEHSRNEVHTSFLIGSTCNSDFNLNEQILHQGWKKLPSQLEKFYSIHEQLAIIPGIYEGYNGLKNAPATIKSIQDLSVMDYMNREVIEQNDQLTLRF